MQEKFKTAASIRFEPQPLALSAAAMPAAALAALARPATRPASTRALGPIASVPASDRSAVPA